MTRDGRYELAVWKRLLAPECVELIARAAATDTGRPSEVAALRARWPADVVGAAIELARARDRAAAKFPDAARLVADVAGVEQATSCVVATHKTQRFAALPGAPPVVYDLCCGIGGDAMALTRGSEVVGVDRDPRRAWMTEHNAGCATRADDVEAMALAGAVVHLDPSRRDEGSGRRSWRYADCRPGPAFIADLLARCPDAAVKLGPGVDAADLPGLDTREIEYINENGTLVQAVLWSGRLAHHRGERTATRLPDGISYHGSPRPDPAPADGPDGYLLVPDPALERAGLVGARFAATATRSLHPGLGLLTAPAIDATGWCRSYEVLATLPWRSKRLKAWLSAHEAGILTVKTRGKAVDPERAQRELRGAGDHPFTVFGLRLGTRVVAVITRPCAASPPASA